MQSHRLLNRRALMAMLAAVSSGARPAAATDLDVLNRLLDEALYRSQARSLLETVADRYGPRLTGSPSLRACQGWAISVLKSWGLSEVRSEPFAFGRGWEARGASLELLEPWFAPLPVLANAWTVSSQQPLEAALLRAKLETSADLAAASGALRGKILLLKDPVDLSNTAAPAADPLDLHYAAEPYPLSARRAAYANAYSFKLQLAEFLVREGVAGIIDPSHHSLGVIQVEGENYRSGRTFPVPRVTTSAEAYNRLLRLAEGPGARVRLHVDNRFSEASEDRNVLADLPGQGADPEVVLLGAHLDSWHGATGASDNAAGVAVMMEAMRILVRAGIRPRRTIRLALWGGEEQLMLGSSAYVARWLARRPSPTDAIQAELPALTRVDLWPVTTLPAYDRFSAYFNLDGGAGPIIGVETTENLAAAPLLTRWLAPYFPDGAAKVSLARSYGSDHIAFDLFGLPAFNFLQAPGPAGELPHHTTLDTVDYVRTADLVRNASIVAGMAYAAAVAPDRAPRKPFARTAPVRLTP